LTNDEDDFVDAGEKVKAAAGRRRKGAARDNDTKEQLQIPPSSTPVRGTSPTKQDQSDLLVSALKLGEGNPKWFKSSEVGLFTEHKDIVNAVAWSPGNDDLLASASNDTSARIWELRKSDKPNTNRLELASTDSNPAHLVHKTVQTGKNPVTCLTWNAAGTILATGAKEGSAMTFTASGSFLYVLTQGTNLAINTIKFSPSGRYLMSGSKSSEVRINEISGDGERHKGIYKGQTGMSLPSLSSRAIS
jgi:transducin (beta)-like 1